MLVSRMYTVRIFYIKNVKNQGEGYSRQGHFRLSLSALCVSADNEEGRGQCGKMFILHTVHRAI